MQGLGCYIFFQVAKLVIIYVMHPRQGLNPYYLLFPPPSDYEPLMSSPLCMYCFSLGDMGRLLLAM